MNLDPYFTLYKKSNLKQTTDLNCKSYKYKVSRKKHRTISLCLWGRQRFLRIQKGLIIKKKTDKLDIISIKNFCSLRSPVRK